MAFSVDCHCGLDGASVRFLPGGKELVAGRVYQGMIARWWRGWADTAANADAYERLLRTTIFPWVREHEGQRGTYLFRHDLEEGAEFATLTLWDSLDSVRAFAGEDYEIAVVPDAAREVLSRWDERSVHYEVVESPDRG